MISLETVVGGGGLLSLVAFVIGLHVWHQVDGLRERVEHLERMNPERRVPRR